MYEENTFELYACLFLGWALNRKHKELLERRFSIIKVGCIERQDDGDTIFGKAFEFSYHTINDLR